MAYAGGGYNFMSTGVMPQFLSGVSSYLPSHVEQSSFSYQPSGKSMSWGSSEPSNTFSWRNNYNQRQQMRRDGLQDLYQPQPSQMQQSTFDTNPNETFTYKTDQFSQFQMQEPSFGRGAQGYGPNAGIMGHSMTTYGGAVPCDESMYMF